MTTLKRSLFILLGVTFASPIIAGVKEVQHSSIKLVKSAQNAEEFYIKVEFEKFDLPATARLTNVQLVLSQRVGAAGQDDSTVSPLGLVNMNERPLVFIAHCFQAKQNPELGNWKQMDSSRALSSVQGVLIPQTIIESEKSRGIRGNNLMGFDMTGAIRSRDYLRSDDLVFLLSPYVEGEKSEELSKVKIEIGNLSATLVLIYAEPPGSPIKPE